MWSGINRRKFPRANYACRISIKKKNTDKTIETTTENIGSGGICVIVMEDLGLFQGVQLEINIDDGVVGQIKCSGTVVWVVKKRPTDPDKEPYKFDTGIEFIDVPDDVRRRIEQTVKDLIKKEK